MNEVLGQFYAGTLCSRYELESECDRWREIVEEYEERNTYVGDFYFQESLQTLSALQEALTLYEDYYDEEGVFKKE